MFPIQLAAVLACVLDCVTVAQSGWDDDGCTVADSQVLGVPLPGTFAMRAVWPCGDRLSLVVAHGLTLRPVGLAFNNNTRFSDLIISLLAS